MHLAIDYDNLELVTILLENRANLEERSFLSLTPLQMAVSKGFIQITKFLIGKGAKINARTKTGLGPLHLVIKHAG